MITKKNILHLFINTALALGSLAFAFALCEAALRFSYYINKGPYSVEKLKKDEGFSESAKCTWPETFHPHPYLGYVQHNLRPCGWPVSNLALYGKNLPDEKNDKYVIMVSGGSVAQNITSTFPPLMVNWIEKHLDANYQSPNGKPFYVVTAAMGGWKQPNQIYMLLKHHRQIDAFLSLEGYNELQAIQNKKFLETPAYPYFLMMDYPDFSARPIKLLKELRLYIQENAVLSKSYIAIVGFAKLRNTVINKFNADLKHSHLLKFFSYPDNWTDREKIEAGLNQYFSYLISLDAIATSANKPAAVFFQPIPNLHKKLHPKDWPPRVGINPDLYLEMEDRLLKADFKAITFISLKKIYENNEEWIYKDDIHSPMDGKTGYSLGYDIMGKNIADRLAETWKLKRKRKRTSHSSTK